MLIKIICSYIRNYFIPILLIRYNKFKGIVNLFRYLIPALFLLIRVSTFHRNPTLNLLKIGCCEDYCIWDLIWSQICNEANRFFLFIIVQYLFNGKCTWSTCHLMMGRRGFSSASFQCLKPGLYSLFWLQPSLILPIGSPPPIKS